MLKCLSILQPYAQLIITGEKFVENRSWRTNYRGPILIHAGKSRRLVENYTADLLNKFSFGAIVGNATIVDCIHISEIKANPAKPIHAKILNHVHTAGPWCWILADFSAFVLPVPYKGQQQIFNVPTEVI